MWFIRFTILWCLWILLTFGQQWSSFDFFLHAQLKAHYVNENEKLMYSSKYVYRKWLYNWSLVTQNILYFVHLFWGFRPLSVFKSWQNEDKLLFWLNGKLIKFINILIFVKAIIIVVD